MRAASSEFKYRRGSGGLLAVVGRVVMVIVGSFMLEGNDDENAVRKTGKEAKSAGFFCCGNCGTAIAGIVIADQAIAALLQDAFAGILATFSGRLQGR